MDFEAVARGMTGIALVTAAMLGPMVVVAEVAEGRPTSGPSAADTLMPMPARIERCAGNLEVPPVVTYTLTPQTPDSPRLRAALSRLGQNTESDFMEGDPALLAVTVAQQSAPYPGIDTDESYRLSIDAQGIQLHAVTVYGALHGLQTLGQLLQRSTTLECMSIEDRPRYPWRGLMLDVVRHWMPLAVVKRQIDAMAHYKMNVLHWHLSDDQGFRVQSFRYPQLHTTGSDGNYYTQAQVRELVEYAAARGVRVVPEFDLPGHSRSWQIAFPELSSRPGKQYYLYHQDGIFSDPLDPTRKENLELLANIIGEMATLFPDAYFHVGGDEVNTNAWEENPRIQQFMKERDLNSAQALQAWFISWYAALLQELGRIPIGWDEVAGEQYPADAVVNKWRTLIYSDTEKRNPIVLSAGFYLDHMQSAWRHYRNDPARLPNADGALVLGGEASAWAESIDPQTIDARVWPRTIAIAELLWSPAAFTAGVSEQDLYRRMTMHSNMLEQRGLSHNSHTRDWLVGLLGAKKAEPVLTLASVSRPEMFASLPTLLPRFFRWPWDDTIYDEPLPLDGFIDHLPPESFTAWQFNQTVDRFLRHRSDEDRDYLNQQLLRWRDNHDALLAVLAQAPELNSDIAVLSLALNELAMAGLTALHSLDKGQRLSDSRHRKIALKYDFLDPEMSAHWFKGELLRWRNLVRPLILLQVKLPMQRGIARLVAAAEGQVEADDSPSPS